MRKDKKKKPPLKLFPELVTKQPDFKCFDINFSEILPQKPKVHKRRHKTDPLTISASLCLNGISAKITATPEDWLYFYNFFLEYPEGIGWEVYNNFILPAHEEIGKTPLPRGKQKQTSGLVSQIKLAIGWLYPFLSYWCKQPLENFPDYLKKLIEQIRKKNLEELIIKQDRKSYNAIALTAYCIEQVYGEKQLKSFFEFEERESLENFRITYISKNNRVKTVFKRFIEGKSHQEIQNLAYRYPLRSIFESIKIL